MAGPFLERFKNMTRGPGWHFDGKVEKYVVGSAQALGRADIGPWSGCHFVGKVEKRQYFHAKVGNRADGLGLCRAFSWKG